MNEPSLALTGVLLIDGTGAPAVPDATVVITGNKITAAGASVAIPPQARIIELPGKSVLPGLIDAHVHLGGLGLGSTPSFGGRAATDDYLGARTDALRHGVTTQRSLGDYLHDSVAVRDEIDNGTLTGSRLLTSGPSFQVEGGHPNSTVWGGDPTALREAARVPTTAQEAARMVDELTAARVDLIKIIISENAFLKPPRPDLKIPWQLTEAIVNAAHANGLTVAAHIENLPDAQRAVDTGIDDIEHLLGLTYQPPDEAEFDQLFASMKAQGTYLVPTMGVRHGLRRPDADPRELTFGNQLVRRAYEAGVKIGVGSDAPAPGLHGRKLLAEIVMMVHDQGIPTLDALSAATRTNAELLGRSDTLGTVEPGKLADLSVVSGNPLEDITAIGSIHQVIQNGTIVIDRG